LLADTMIPWVPQLAAQQKRISPSVAPEVGEFPEVVEDRVTGPPIPFGDSEKMTRAERHYAAY
jgi:hypothetical protein